MRPGCIGLQFTNGSVATTLLVTVLLITAPSRMARPTTALGVRPCLAWRHKLHPLTKEWLNVENGTLESPHRVRKNSLTRSQVPSQVSRSFIAWPTFICPLKPWTNCSKHFRSALRLSVTLSSTFPILLVAILLWIVDRLTQTPNVTVCTLLSWPPTLPVVMSPLEVCFED